MRRTTAMALAIVAGGCYDFGRFHFRDGGAPDGEAPDGATPDGAVDLGAGDLAGPCIEPPSGNLLFATDSSFALGRGDWTLVYGSAATADAPPGCFYPKALRLCATTVGGNGPLGEVFLNATNAVDPTKTYTAMLWIALESTLPHGHLVVQAVDGAGRGIGPMNVVDAAPMSGWQLLTTGVQPPPGANALQVILSGEHPGAMMPQPDDCLAFDRAWLGAQ